MTLEELYLLDSPELRDAVSENTGRDPVSIALDKRIPHAALVASQVKYLQRARKKLPAYYAVRAVIPPLAFEQSSGERAAAHKDFSGELCIDLTCGLGVDSYYLSKKFERVVSVERDEVTAEAARINFRRLGAGNITVVNISAEEFLSGFIAGGGTAGLIYADPDRRGEGGRKLVRLEDSSPDVVAMMPELRKAAPKIVIKTSPLFDVAEAFRLFGRHCRVDVVSDGGESKEVLIELDDRIPAPSVKASILGSGQAEYPYESPMPVPGEFTPPYRYMVIPDVALRKARLAGIYFRELLPDAYIQPGGGFVFSDTLPSGGQDTDIRNIHGKVFEVTGIRAYSPRTVKKELEKSGIKSADIYLHDFPRSAPEVCRDLGIREGGTAKLAFTSLEGSLWMICMTGMDK